MFNNSHFSGTSIGTHDITTPLIVQQPTAEELLFIVTPPGEIERPFVIPCEAEGEPAPQYRWTKNGEPFNYATYGDRISQQPSRGTLIFTAPKDEDVGQYQCFAYNEWGTATSNSVFVRKSELQSFKDTDNDVHITAEEGYPYKLTCQPPDGYPKPLVLWLLINIDQGTLKTANNSRITCDPEGNLWFSNVTRKDSIETTNFAYICAVKSFFRWEYKLGNKVFLTVTHKSGSEMLNRSPPVKQYTTKSHEVALRGKNVELYCIFGGTPLPEIVWKKDGQTILWSDRVKQINYGKTLVINPVTYEDEGAYTCEASNGVGSAQSHSINLSVEASPSFNEAP
ncbi:neuroglian-like [Leguminivora glycinivorella]|uniref:neuroglian-like n=1 Tax=Leguminivora glycinivorella TaxID=1035111 RepID=UPI00200BC641|nr:neuroglian-like [Leguminivora glycinivorella]